MHKTILIGNLGQDPENPFDDDTCRLRVAVNETWKDKEGQKQEHTEWYTVMVYGPRGANCTKYLSKGSKVYIEGRLRTREYLKDDEKRYATDLIAQDVQFLDSKPKSDEGAAPEAPSGGRGRGGRGGRRPSGRGVPQGEWK